MPQDVPYWTKAAIENLINRYGRAMDGGLQDEFLAVWDLTDGGVLSVVETKFEGKEGLSAFVKATSDNFKFTKHWTANYDMALAKDGSVEGHGSAFAITVDNDDKASLMSGSYTDRFVERDGKWAFQKRHVSMDISIDIASGVPTLL